MGEWVQTARTRPEQTGRERQEGYQVQTDHHLARMDHRPSRIAIDGQMHRVVPIPTLEGIAFGARGSITFPPPGERGWATTRVGSHRFAAWLETTP